MAIINWRQECLNVIPIFTKEKEARQKGAVILLPGWNYVPDEDWLNARMHVKDQIAKGWIQEKGSVIPAKKVKGKTEEAGEEAPVNAEETLAKVSLRSLGEAEALEVIAFCNNPKSLSHWNELTNGENRSTIREALKKRIEEVEKKIPSKEEDKPAAKRYDIQGQKNEVDVGRFV